MSEIIVVQTFADATDKELEVLMFSTSEEGQLVFGKIKSNYAETAASTREVLEDVLSKDGTLVSLVTEATSSLKALEDVKKVTVVQYGLDATAEDIEAELKDVEIIAAFGEKIAEFSKLLNEIVEIEDVEERAEFVDNIFEDASQSDKLGLLLTWFKYLEFLQN